MSLWILANLGFLGVSLLFYVLFAGADFGAGVLEVFLGKGQRAEQRRLISHAMAPVWEANHVWLILAVVILFVGFPKVYTTISTYLHIPILALLMGIVARGCAFTFRYYDTLGNEYYRAFSRTFALSSLWTSFFLGVVAGGMFLGRIDPDGVDYYTLYLAPWFNAFCLTLGAFTTALFAFLAAVYLVGEATDEDLKNTFRAKARVFAILMILFGGLVFLAAESSGLSLVVPFFTQPFSLAAFSLATLLWLPFWASLRAKDHIMRTRVLGATIVGLVLLGWYAVQFPFAIRFAGLAGSGIRFVDAAAPEVTLRALLGALMVGSVLVFSALAYLFKVFKWQTFEKERR